MKGTLLETIEEAEAKMVSNKNRMQRFGGDRPFYYLSKDEKEQLVKLVNDNQDKQPKDFLPAIAKETEVRGNTAGIADLWKEMDLPEKTVYNFAHRIRARWVKHIVNDEKDTCKND